MKKMKQLSIFSLDKRKGKLSNCPKRFYRLQINSVELFIIKLRVTLKSCVQTFITNILQAFIESLLCTKNYTKHW